MDLISSSGDRTRTQKVTLLDGQITLKQSLRSVYGDLNVLGLEGGCGRRAAVDSNRRRRSAQAYSQSGDVILGCEG
jgi:hypothetical protein